MSPREMAELMLRKAVQSETSFAAFGERFGVIAEGLARGVIGHENVEWPALQPATVAEKARLGYVNQISSTDPELRTGRMRGTIEHSVESIPGLTIVRVGSDDPILKLQELGSGASNLPARPMIALAAVNALPFLEDMAQAFIREIV